MREAPVGIEPTMAVLQTAALPLGHGAQHLGPVDCTTRAPRQTKSASGVPSSTPLARSTRTTISQVLQTGMLFIITQQLQPCCIIIIMQLQVAWIMAIIAGSPLV